MGFSNVVENSCDSGDGADRSEAKGPILDVYDDDDDEWDFF
jgi:hypothetical protein